MHFLKRHTSRNINIITGRTTIKPTITSEGATSEGAISEGAIGQSRLRVTDCLKTNGIIKQFNKYVLGLKNQFIQKYGNKNPFPKFRWEKSFRDHIERDEKGFGIKWNYIKYNPIKHNMPDDWLYVFTNSKYADLSDDYIL